MLRTQIQLGEECYRKLREVAARQHRSMADCIRQGISLFLKQSEEEEEGLSEIAGKFPATNSGNVKRHDRFWADSRRVADGDE